MNGELILCISCTLVFLLGLLTRRFGTAGGVVLLLLVANICISSPDSRAPYGTVLSITLFTTLIVLHSKSHGKKSPLYRYNPYNSQSELPKVLRVFLLALAVVTTVIAVLVRILGRFNAEVGTSHDVEIEILCHSEFSTDLTYDNPFWERAVDGGYETFGGKLPVHFFLVVKNHNSQLPLCIYRPQYSFGYYDLHFEYLCNGIVKPIVRHDGIRWMKNVPEKSVVEPGSQLAMPVCLDSTLWRNVPEIGLSNWSEVSDGRCMIRAIMTNGVWKVGSRYEWATPHVLTSQWTTVSLISPERDIEWEH